MRLPDSLTRLGWPLLLALTMLVVQRTLLAGQTFPVFDADNFFAPAYGLVADFARAGKLLWWNPWIQAGAPDCIEPQVGAHSPIVLAFAFATGPTLRGFVVYWSCIWFLAGLGCYRLGLRLGAPGWGAFVAALGFMLSGFFIGHAQHTSYVWSFAVLPWLVERAHVAARSGRWLPALHAGCLLGLTGLGGYPAFVVCHGALVAAWMVLAAPPRRVADGARLLAQLALLGVVALVILSPTYLAFFFEAPGYSGRAAALPRHIALGEDALNPRALTTFASPYLPTLPAKVAWGYTDPSGANLYVGALLFDLGIFGLVARPRAPRRWLLAASAVLALFIAMSVSYPLRGWLYDLAPPTRFFRHSVLFGGYAIFACAVLAFLGARDLHDWSARVRRRALVAVSASAFALAVLAYAIMGSKMARPMPVIELVHLVLVWGGALALSIAATGAHAVRRRPLIVAALVGFTLLDLGSAAELATTVRRDEPGAAEQWRRLMDEHRAELDLLAGDGVNRVPFSNWSNDLGPGFTNKAAYLKLPVFRGYHPLRNAYGIDIQWMKRPGLEGVVTGRERFWFATDADAIVTAPGWQLFEAFAKRAASGDPPLLLHPRELMAGAPAAPPSQELFARVAAAPAARRAAVTLRRYLPDELALAFDAPAAGWLMISDRWSPGWTARVNGRPVDILGADLMFRAVPVAPGPNEITMVYRPFGRPWLVVVSWSALAAALVATAVDLIRRRSRRDRRRARSSS